LRRHELDRVDRLGSSAGRWEQARRLAAYIDAVRQQAIRRHGSIEAAPDVARWLEWAEAHRHSIDPLSSDKELPSIKAPDDQPESEP
jgi:hypothetical protein